MVWGMRVQGDSRGGWEHVSEVGRVRGCEGCGCEGVCEGVKGEGVWADAVKPALEGASTSASENGRWAVALRLISLLRSPPSQYAMTTQSVSPATKCSWYRTIPVAGEREGVGCLWRGKGRVWVACGGGKG
eukprot:scaffold5165_cov111-Isochrysis_galbana.AAC.1